MKLLQNPFNYVVCKLKIVNAFLHYNKIYQTQKQLFLKFFVIRKQLEWNKRNVKRFVKF